MYIEILKDIYTDSSVTVHLHKESEKIRIKRGVRQGDTISPKLFTATLERIFRRLNWENKGVKIDGEFLSNLRFADDIFLCTETPQELQQMLQEISDESRRMSLKMNIAKTKVMVVDNSPINMKKKEEEEETLFDPKSTNVQITIPHISDIQFKQLCTHIYRHYVHKHSS